jgi:hypothetical protein
MKDINLQIALKTIRTGEGDLRPIINYYAESEASLELLPYLDEQGIIDTVLYILSEIPKVDERILDKIEYKIENGDVPISAMPWAEEILLNRR